MELLKCEKCGEYYSDTYKRCPFCQEEEALKKGKSIRRRGKRLDKKQRSAGAGGVMLTLAVVIIAGVLGYVYFGEQLAGFMGIRTGDNRDDLSQFEAEQADKQQDQQSKPDEEQQDAQAEEEKKDEVTTTTPVEPVGPLALDYASISIPVGVTARITATGGTGEVIWDSSNINIATVDGGSVTGVAGGAVTITAKAGEETVTCEVTVTGDTWVSPVDLSLSKTDVTVRSGDPQTFQLKINGGEHGAVTWASKNPNVATVSADGVVKRVGKGTTTITASVDGHELECIVRCS